MTSYGMASYGYPARGDANSSGSTSQNSDYLKGKIPKVVITPEQRFTDVLASFKNCFSDYKDCTDFPLLGSLLMMDQEVKVGDMRIARGSVDDKEVTGKLPCGKDGPIIVTHAFEAKGYIPIGKAKFKVIKRKDLTKEEEQSIWMAMSNSGGFGGYDLYAKPFYQDKTVLDNQEFDEFGIAEITLAPCDAGYSYHIIINPDASSASNVKALESSYAELITKSCTLLETVWKDKAEGGYGQYQQWIEFEQMGGVNWDAVRKKFISALVDKVLELYDTVKLIFNWVSQLDTKKLLEYLSKDAVEELEKLYKNSQKEISDMLVVLSDEVLVFICVKALYSYFCLLTPQQLGEFAADAIGEIIIMIVLYTVLPGAVLKIALEGLDTVAGFNPTTELTINK